MVEALAFTVLGAALFAAGLLCGVRLSRGQGSKPKVGHALQVVSSEDGGSRPTSRPKKGRRRRVTPYRVMVDGEEVKHATVNEDGYDLG